MHALPSEYPFSALQFDLNYDKKVQNNLDSVFYLKQEALNLISEAGNCNVDVRQQVIAVKDLSGIALFSTRTHKYNDIRIRAQLKNYRIIIHHLKRKIQEKRREIPVPPPLPPVSQNLPQREFHMGLQECDANDIQISENYLKEWIQKAQDTKTNIIPILQKLIRVKELRDSYLPVEGAESFGEKFKIHFYIHYLNLYCNQIIREVCIKEIKNLAEIGRNMEIFKNKIGFVNAEERLLLNEVPLASSFFSPCSYNDKCQSVLGRVQERFDKIVNYKI